MAGIINWFTRGTSNEGAPGVQSQEVGFDRSSLDVREDHLDRVRIAQQTYALLVNLPNEWSVRVGLSGTWGSGKTTVANWVAKIAETERHLVVRLNPWGARSMAEMWLSFAIALFDSLKAQGISLAGLTDLRNAVRLGKFRSQLEQVGEVLGAPAAGISLVQSFFPVNAEELKNLRTKLGNRRVVVIIDDLDRTDPELLPQALLTFRELLNIDGFSFLLPFDEDIVSAALTNHNPAFRSGESFVDKILDFRVRLPEPTSKQRHQLFASEIAKHCDFIPKRAIEGLDDILPGNPRKLKAAVRNMMMFRPEAMRHGPGDIVWDAVIFASLLKQECAPFYEEYVRETFADPEQNGWIAALMDKEKAEPAEAARLEGLIQKYASNDEKMADRLRSVCNSWRKRHGLDGVTRVSYTLRLLDRPDALTWPEYQEALTAWKKAHAIEDVVNWVATHAPKHGVSTVAVASELVAALLDRYNYLLDSAANSDLLQEHSTIINEALETLTLLEYLLTKGLPPIATSLITPATFERMLSVAKEWHRFTVNPSDALARSREASLLRSVTAKVDTDWEAYEKLVRSLHSDLFDESKGMEVLEELSGTFSGLAQTSALNSLTREGAMQEFFPRENNVAARRELLNISGALWSPLDKSPLKDTLSTAGSHPIVQKNALKLLKLVRYAANSWGDPERSYAQSLIKNRATISALWEASVAQPLQFRNLADLRKLRAELVALGAEATVLNAPDWLLRGSDHDQVSTRPSHLVPAMLSSGNM